ncbi:MAG: hypothetical protein MUE50_11330 [Pirellulaceae bacterium]|jgi:hypothetical protein|nr:hypothetical protein [Pirellulaceae bacterium]MCU0978088.1 hypothetical protein [Pirellulaceae bacterium]
MTMDLRKRFGIEIEVWQPNITLGDLLGTPSNDGLVGHDAVANDGPARGRLPAVEEEVGQEYYRQEN